MYHSHKDVMKEYYSYLEKLSKTKKIVGYFDTYFPEEFVYAMGLHPVRLISDEEEPIRASEFLQGFCCPYAKNLLEQAIKHKLDFLSAVVFTRYCDSLRGVYEVWKSEKLTPIVEFIRYSQVVRKEAVEYLANEFKSVFDRLCDSLGCEYTFYSLQDAITMVNKKRKALKYAYNRRKEFKQVSSAYNFYEFVLSATWLEPSEFLKRTHNFDKLFRKYPQVVNGKVDMVPTCIVVDKGEDYYMKSKAVKVIVSATELDNLEFYKLLDEIGFYVISDDVAFGTRYTKDLVREDGKTIDELIRNIALRYIMKTPCSVKDPSDRRIDELVKEVKTTEAKGVIFYRTRFCDSEGVEYAFIKKRLEAEGIPHIYIESDHRLSNYQQLYTRLEAFYEQIAGIFRR